jgi:hypothetical protein
MTGGDAITIVRARGRRLAKLVRGDGRIDDYARRAPSICLSVGSRA